MDRTGTHKDLVGPENVAAAYGALSDGSPVRIADIQLGDDTLAGAAGGVRSTLTDMLKLTKAWLKAAKHQFENRVTSTPSSPLKQVEHIMSSQIPMNSPSYHECSYAMGFVRTQLPGQMGAIGLKGRDVSPVVGKAGPSQPVIYHQGSKQGTLAAYNLLLGTQSAVVVLSNTLSLVDTADWVGQLLLESVLDVPKKNDYLQITKHSVERAMAWYPAVYKELKENRSSEAPRPLEDYVGVFWNEVGILRIDVTLTEGRLNIVFQGLLDEVWRLYHWEEDTFTWLPDSRDELARRGRFTGQSPEYYKIKFGVSSSGQVERLTWVHEGWNVPRGEDFFKLDTQSAGD